MTPSPLDTAGTALNADYTPRQSEFLYLVATHSGYFLARHFFKFTETSSGKAFRSFVAKAIEKRHVREEIHSQVGARRYHLYSKPLYAQMGKENSSNRRQHRISKIIVKLEALDFVLDHLDATYLEEESDKVRYFHDELGIEKHLLPARVYPARNTGSDSTTRYFVDKYPIFLSSDRIVSFAYIDDPVETTQAFRTHLFQYLSLFRALPAPFRLFFASAVESKFTPAERTFRAVISSPADVLPDRELAEYFELRRRWEAKDLTGFTTELLRKRVEGAKKFTGSHHEALYRRWLESRNAPPDASKNRTEIHAEFVPYLLPS
jgi:hypothetical protein